MAAPKEGGFKMSLGGLKNKPGLKAAPAQKDAKKARLALLGDDEPDDSNKQQEISGWDVAEGGAVDIGGKKEKTPPRVIPLQPDGDWRTDLRRRQLAKAPHVQAQNRTEEDDVKVPEVQYGLTILRKEVAPEEAADKAASGEPMEGLQDNLTEAERLEKKAMDALLNGKSGDDDLVIPVQADEAAFRKDVDEAPEAPTLAAYEATPIEGFGAALLRGMGWKGEDPSQNGSKQKEVKRRPALLGIGAKAEAAVGVELGEWSKKGKKGKSAQGYNPVALRNKKTGELITEEELKMKLEQQDMVKDEKPSRPRRDHSDDDRHERRRDRRDDNYDSGSRRDRDRRDDRRREKDDYHDNDRRRDKKERYRDDDYDSERRRDKRRERDDDYDSERRREKRRDRDRRDRSRSPRDDKREKRHDRYRSRSRDSKRDRDRRDRSRDDDRRERRKDRDYDDDREERRRRHKDDKYNK